MFAAIEEMAAFTREALGEDRIAWLRALPRAHVQSGVVLVHATPASLWKAPMPAATDGDLQSVYAGLGHPIAVYGHIHRPYVRSLPGMIVANSGSVGQPHDGDRHASYLLIDGIQPAIRRVEYDVDREIKALAVSRMPHAEWMARILESASPQIP